MVQIVVSKNIKAPKEKVAEYFGTPGEYFKAHRKYFKSFKIISTENNVAYVEEEWEMGGRLSSFTHKITLNLPNKIDMEIIEGDGIGSKEVISFEEAGSYTKVTYHSDFKFGGITGGIIGLLLSRQMRKMMEAMAEEDRLFVEGKLPFMEQSRAAKRPTPMNKIIPLLILSLLLMSCMSPLMLTGTPEVKVATLVAETPTSVETFTINPPIPITETLQLPKTLEELGIPYITYTDSFAGLAIEYPTGWIITDMSDDVKKDAWAYTVSVRSGEPEAVFKSQNLEDASIASIDITIFIQDVKTLEQAIDERRAQLQQSESGQPVVIQSEEDWTLRSGLKARRFLINLGNTGEGTRDQLVSELVTIIRGKMVLVTGMGDLSLFNGIAVSLRETN